MPFMNFKIVNTKNLKMEYKRSFVEKTRAITSKIQEKHMTSTSLLMFSPEFSLERELFNTSVLSSHT